MGREWLQRRRMAEIKDRQYHTYQKEYVRYATYKSPASGKTDAGQKVMQKQIFGVTDADVPKQKP